MFKEFTRDATHAVRSLGRMPGFAAITILTLSLGIGANTALFTAINGLLLRTLSVSHPEAVVSIRWFGTNDMVRVFGDYGPIGKNAAGEAIHRTFSYASYQAMLSANQTLVDIAGLLPSGQANVIYGSTADVASSLLVTGNYFKLLGTSAQIGRLITPEDDRDTATPVAVLSDAYWLRRFGRDPGVIGKPVTLGRIAFTIIGVTPKEFSGVMDLTSPPPDLTAPLTMDRELGGTRLRDGTNWSIPLFGRLKPGITPEQVKGNLEGVVQGAAREGWASYYSTLSPEQQLLPRNQKRTAAPHLEVASASRGIYDASETDLNSATVLTAVVGLILIVVCSNVANLLLARGAGRKKEISVRLSMGATRWRLIRQLLAESLVLSLAGGALGIVAAYWVRPLMPFAADAALDWHVFAFVGALCLTIAAAFGILPAMRATRVDLSLSMNESGRSIVHSRSLLSKALLIAQVAISVVVLVGAGLFLQTVHNLRNVDAGFKIQNLIVLGINPRMNGYDANRIGSLYETLQQELDALPGVVGVSHSRQPLLSGSSTIGEIHREGQAAINPRGLRFWFMTVSPEFFQTHAIPVVNGRGLDPKDLAPNGRPVGVINETAVRQYFPGEDPIGKRFGLSLDKNSAYEIVGVVRDTRYNNVRDAVPPTVYNVFPLQTTQPASFEIRTADDARGMMTSVRALVQRIDPTLPIGSIRTQNELAEKGFVQERFFAASYSLFGGVALLLASIGLFGLMSYNVARRTSEIGVRMALGAQRRMVLRTVLTESLGMVAIGIVAGVAISLAAGRFVARLLYGLSPADSPSIIGAAVTMFVVAFAAAYLPALSASRVDPIVALRHD